MEWLVLLSVTILTAMYICWPQSSPPLEPASEGKRLHIERRDLLTDLSEIDADYAMGRISDDERITGRQALAPKLRAVTERLHDLDETLEALP